MNRGRYFKLASLLSLASFFVAAVASGAIPSTQPAASPQKLEDAISLYAAAAQRKDAVAMSAFYYVEKSSDNRLPLAKARYLLATVEFDEQSKLLQPRNYADGYPAGFKLHEEELEFPNMYNIQQHDDDAVLSTGGPTPSVAWFKRQSGVWREDITPPIYESVSDVAQDLEEDSAAIDRVSSNIRQGRLKNWRQVRDALGAAMLNQTNIPDFLYDELDLHAFERHPPHGIFLTTPQTPAGAMNRLVDAIKRGDEKLVQDSLFMPMDKDGTARAAAAHDFVVGFKFLEAAESKFSNREDSNRIASWAGAVDRELLVDHYDEEWRILTDYADLAPASRIEISISANSKKMTDAPLMIHCSDGHWRTGERFPKNVRQLKRQSAMYQSKDAILEQSAKDIRAGMYKSDGDAINAILSQMKNIGPSWNLALGPG